METVLLPSSAAAFAPRSSPIVVLNSKIEPWLVNTLKRINKLEQLLTKTLSSPDAIWTLCSIIFPKALGSEKYQMIHVEAYVVCVDMILRNEVVFKLTPETIEALVEFHKYNTAANTWDWTGKGDQLMRLQQKFFSAANKFVYRTDARVLEGLEEDGAGELLGQPREEVKTEISRLFIPLLPPRPQAVGHNTHLPWYAVLKVGLFNDNPLWDQGSFIRRMETVVAETANGLIGFCGSRGEDKYIDEHNVEDIAVYWLVLCLNWWEIDPDYADFAVKHWTGSVVLKSGIFEKFEDAFGAAGLIDAYRLFVSNNWGK